MAQTLETENKHIVDQTSPSAIIDEFERAISLEEDIEKRVDLKSAFAERAKQFTGADYDRAADVFADSF